MPGYITFDEISDFWRQHLWPERISEIERVSCIDSQGNIDMSLLRFQPFFIGLFENQKLVGVVSYCQTSDREARLRGICVHPDYRDRGYATKLIYFVFQDLKKTPVEIIWTMAREANIKFYRHWGFLEYKKVSQYEYGPHQLMRAEHW